jgi:hypothetical protein
MTRPPANIADDPRNPRLCGFVAPMDQDNPLTPEDPMALV